jgi:hypothetical protein
VYIGVVDILSKELIFSVKGMCRWCLFVVVCNSLKLFGPLSIRLTSSVLVLEVTVFKVAILIREVVEMLDCIMMGSVLESE